MTTGVTTGPTPTRTSLVSIVVPTYNRHSLLRAAIASVLAQSYHNWELIIVDDGSTDETPLFLAALADERIRAITLPRCGNPARLRNVGLELARGGYVA